MDFQLVKEFWEQMETINDKYIFLKFTFVYMSHS